jgi:hypothetical protein
MWRNQADAFMWRDDPCALPERRETASGCPSRRIEVAGDPDDSIFIFSLSAPMRRERTFWSPANGGNEAVFHPG